LNVKRLLQAALVASFTPALAHAAVLFNNPASGQFGDCSFNTACAAILDPGENIIAAQEFTLSSRSTVTSAAFTQLDFGLQDSTINWSIRKVGRRSGLPKKVLASGSSTITSNAVIGSLLDLTIREMFFDIPDITLKRGEYYLTLQQVSDTPFGLLADGASQDVFAAESFNGGKRWQGRYGSSQSVAIELFGDPAGRAVPEPGAWALMTLGFAAAGGALRRRRQLRTA